jgi:hypothetical protein
MTNQVDKYHHTIYPHSSPYSLTPFNALVAFYASKGLQRLTIPLEEILKAI